MRRLWHLACTARELHVRRSRSDSAILCLPEIRCTGHRGRVRRGHSETDVYNTYNFRPLPSASRYAKICTDVNRSLFCDGRARRRRRTTGDSGWRRQGIHRHGGLRGIQGTIGLGISKRARAFKHRAQLTRAAAVSPHMHVKDYITSLETPRIGAQAACFADSTTADASVSAQGGF
jgi:hypothetical protein